MAVCEMRTSGTRFRTCPKAACLRARDCACRLASMLIRAGLKRPCPEPGSGRDEPRHVLERYEPRSRRLERRVGESAGRELEPCGRGGGGLRRHLPGAAAHAVGALGG